MNSIILYISPEFRVVMKIVFKRHNFWEMINYLLCNIEWLQWCYLGLKIRLHLLIMWMD